MTDTLGKFMEVEVRFLHMRATRRAPVDEAHLHAQDIARAMQRRVEAGMSDNYDWLTKKVAQALRAREKGPADIDATCMQCGHSQFVERKWS